MKDNVQPIYIELLEEGTVVYRPVDAVKLDQNIFKIIGIRSDDEVWSFQTNDIVQCEFKELNDGRF